MNVAVAVPDADVAGAVGLWLGALGALSVQAPPVRSAALVAALREAGLDGSSGGGAIGRAVVRVGQPGSHEEACPVAEGPGDDLHAARALVATLGDWAERLVARHGLQRAFGDSVRPAFVLEEGQVFLNHGSYGATPRVVVEAREAWMRQLEAQPVRFMQQAPGLLRRAMGRVAPLLGASVDDLVFVDNATSGVMAVLRSLALGPGDAILTTRHAYAAVDAAIRFVAERSGAEVQVAEVPFPLASDDEVLTAVLEAVTPATRVAVIDHVASVSGLAFPIRQLVSALQERGVWVLVDGAHVPGLLPLDLEALGADWYVGNLHKWLYAPKGCGVLYARSEVQEGLAPLVVSLGYGGGFASSFEYQGTRDPSGWLAAEAAVDFVQSCGGLDAVRVHNRRLAHAMAHRVAERCGLGWGGPPHAFAAMVTLMLPELSGLDEARALVARLWSEHRVQSFAGALGTTAALRISANLYNRVDEADALAEALSACA